MKSMSAALAAHYALKTTTVVGCWRAELTDGTIINATMHDSDLGPIDGEMYLSTASFNSTVIASASDMSPDNLEVDGVLASPAITDEDIYSGRWDYARIEIFEVNFMDLTMGKNVLRTGTLGEVQGGRSKFKAEMRGLMQNYSRTIVRLMTKDCTAVLGDSRCKFDLSLVTVTGTIDSVSDNRIIGDAARTENANEFAYGKFTFTSGLNNGLSMEVKASSAGVVELHQIMPFVIAAGDTYTLSQGCPGRFVEDCKVRFNNVINFRGFPHLPQADIYKVGGVP